MSKPLPWRVNQTKEVFMKKAAVLVAVLFLVAGMVTSALAERETVTTVKEITVLGKPCAVIQTVDRGGPAGKGFFGTTRVSQPQ